jgi:hypothetical protein
MAMTRQAVALILALSWLSGGCATQRQARVNMPVQAQILEIPAPYRTVPGLTAQQKERYFRLKRISIGRSGPVVGQTRCSWEELPNYLRRSGAGDEATQLSKALDTARVLGQHPDRFLACSTGPANRDNQSLLGALPFTHFAVKAALERPLLRYNQRLASALGQKEAADKPHLKFIPPPPMQTGFTDGLASSEEASGVAAGYRITLHPGNEWAIGGASVTSEEMVDFVRAQKTVIQTETPHHSPLVRAVGWTVAAGAMAFVVGSIVSISHVDSNGYHGPDWSYKSMVYGGAVLLVAAPIVLLLNHYLGPYDEYLNRVASEHNQAVDEFFGKLPRSN